MYFSWRVWLVGLVFLFFPLADLKIITNAPIYVAEVPLLLVSGLLGWVFVRRKQEIISTTPDKKFIGWMTIFLIGGLAAFFLNRLPLESLGLVKSFIILPLLLAAVLRSLIFSCQEHAVVLSFWYGGVAIAALVALTWFFFGGTTYDSRLAAWYDSPNQLAFLLGPGVLLGIYFFYQWPTVSKTTMIIKMSAPLLIFWALLLTRSYAMIGAALMTGLFLAYCLKGFENRKFFVWSTISLIGFSCIWLTSEFSTEKYQSLLTLDERSSVSSRIMIWTVGLEVARESFPWGIGIGQFQSAYLSRQVTHPPYLEWAVPEPHNLFLAIFLAGGVMSLVAFFVCLWLGIGYLWVQYKKRQHIPMVSLYACLLLYWLITGIVDTPYFDNYLSLGWWGIIGLIWTFGQHKNQPQNTQGSSSC